MKIAIDIPDKLYKDLQENDYTNIDNADIYSAIKYGEEVDTLSDYSQAINKAISKDYDGSKQDQLKSILYLNNCFGQGLYSYLVLNGFCVAPASTKYHGAYCGGLFDHSMAVTRALVWLTQKLDLKWERNISPVIVGLFHDLCKIDAYYMNKEDNGPITFSYNDDTILPGHGDKSIILLQRFMTLTKEEIACIRWHMGAFDEKENWNYYGKAIEKYPNVLYTHTADMIASKIMGV